jgi:uncharacterized protein (TIGR00369 family)
MSSDPPSGYETGDDVFTRIRAMMQWTPQGRALGMDLISLADGKVRGRIPYSPQIVGDPDTGVIAGGVITTFLDQLCGMAVVLAMKPPGPVATIDLRIDYMRAAEPGRDILAEAHCYKIGRNVAFVRAVAFEDAPDSAVAHATATFMVNPAAVKRPGANLREKKR